jgi:hypothetical protein
MKINKLLQQDKQVARLHFVNKEVRKKTVQTTFKKPIRFNNNNK